jgi:proline-specific peptidases, Bacillus coagulans-type subfamily
MPHDYLAPLAQHAGDDLTIYLYDQFGVGRSDEPAPGDFDRYTVDHYRNEVEAVRQSIAPDGDFLLYGQSWGGMLAQEYALENGAHVDKLVLANTLADTQTAYESMRSVLDELPAEDRETIEAHESRREYDAGEYETALDGAYREHVCRTEEYPGPVASTFERINPDVYGLMWGPNEYVLMETARLRGWDVRDEITSIDVETLVLTGGHDEISPSIARTIAERIPNAHLHEFKESSHMPFWEEPDKHYDRLEAFLRR